MLSGRSVDVNGRTVFVRETGDGPPIVLLHGFPQTGACWNRVAASLAGSSRVIVPDLPGYGRSERPRSYDAGEVASQIVAAVRALGIERAAYVGHDWGGSITFRIALDHPANVERIVVVNAPFRKVDLRRAWHLIAFNVPVFPEAALTLAGDRWLAWMLRAGAAKKDAFEPDALAEYEAAYASLERKRSALEYYRTVTRRRLVGTLLRRGGTEEGRRITVPTTIVWGERDPVLPPELADGIARDIPGSKVERIPNAGHFVPEEAPDELARIISAG